MTRQGRLRRFTGIAGLLACWASTGAAFDTDMQAAELLRRGQVAAAEAVFDRANRSAADRRFFDARVHKLRGDLDQAIALLRETLRLDPNHLNALRELAHTLMLNHEDVAARHHFETLLSVDPNPEMRQGYRRFLAVIDARRWFGVSGHMALLPSTNVNRGSGQSYIDTIFGRFRLAEESKEDSGTGVRLGASGFLRHTAPNRLTLRFDWQASGTSYDNPLYDRADGEMRLSFGHRGRRTSWSTGPYLRKAWLTDGADSTANGLSLNLSRQLPQGRALSVGLSHEMRQYQGAGHRDGPANTLSLVVQQAVSQSLVVWGGLVVEDVRPRAAHQAYRGRRLLAGVQQRWTGGWQTRLQLEIGDRQFAADYPLTDAPRRDDVMSLRIGAQTSEIALWGLSPEVSCTHTRNASTIGLADFDTSECDLSLTRKF